MNGGQLTLAIYAALILIGAGMGFRAGSKASLIAGGASGLLLVAAYVVSRAHLTAGLWFGAVVALAVGGSMVGRWISTGKLFPAGATAIMSGIALVLLVYFAITSRGA